MDIMIILNLEDNCGSCDNFVKYRLFISKNVFFRQSIKRWTDMVTDITLETILLF